MAPLRILAALALTVGSAAAFSPVAPFAARTAVSTPRYDLKVTSPNISYAARPSMSRKNLPVRKLRLEDTYEKRNLPVPYVEWT